MSGLGLKIAGGIDFILPFYRKNYNYFKKYVKIIYLMLFLFDRI